MKRYNSGKDGNTAPRERTTYQDAYFTNPACVEDDSRRMRRPRD